MFRKHYKKIIPIIFLFIFLVMLIITLHYVSPSLIVSTIGIRNSYILAFFVSLFGGVPTMSSVSFMATIVTLVVGGANPFFIGLFAGIGLVIGDFFMVYVGFEGRQIITGKIEEKINSFSKWIKKKPKFLIPIIVYFYMGFTPLPNDFLTLSLGIIEYPWKKLIIPFILGDLTFAMMLAFLASSGIIF